MALPLPVGGGCDDKRMQFWMFVVGLTFLFESSYCSVARLNGPHELCGGQFPGTDPLL